MDTTVHKQQQYILNNRVAIPSIGFGTWQTPNGATAVASVKAALKYGYTHIDTAAIYGNEESVGKAIIESGADRKELFLTSKLWNTERGYDSTLRAFSKTLKDLQTDYLDLYLIHWPANQKQFPTNWQQKNADTWKAFEQLYKDGKIRAIGVSNFLVHHLQALFETAIVKPSVNQIEFHPGYMQKEVVEFCRKNTMLVEAWSPLGTGKLLDHPSLMSIADKYNVSVAQVCIKWCLQHHTLPLPKSVTPSRIQQNREVEQFLLSPDDMNTIDDLRHIGNSGLFPDEVDF